MKNVSTIQMDISGLGFIVYSPFSASGIRQSENYLEGHYWEAEDVARQVMAGTIAGFCTGSPGTYKLQLLECKPATPLLVRYPWWIRLALEVRDRTACIRDLYDLHRWNPTCPGNQSIPLDDGYYRLTVGSRPTASGIVGDDQEIVICFEHVDELPKVSWPGVPFLGDQEDEEQ